MQQRKTVITGTGRYIPPVIKTNAAFATHHFYTDANEPIGIDPLEIVSKFEKITGIAERRYAADDMTASGMAIIAAKLAIESANCDKETIDQIIFAHNFGDVLSNTVQSEAMPALASRVKHALQINNPNCIPYDILFGCPGWLQGVIQADHFIKAGAANKCLIIGAEALSRVVDVADRDCMIFSDGAGACVVEAEDDGASGILSSAVQAHCNEELDFLYMGRSYAPDSDPNIRFIKMKGRKVYEYALKHVPAAMKNCLDKAGQSIHDLKKIFIHQANEKMDDAIVSAFYKLYGVSEVPLNIVPMNIQKLGNSSVATIPTLYDMVVKNEKPEHVLVKGDIILFASVGAGMNINAVCYRY